MRVAFVIRSLERGGAERQLIALARGLRERGHSVCILTFYDANHYPEELAAANVEVSSGAKRSRWDLAGPVRRLVRAIRQFQPDVIHGYLPAGNLVAMVLRLFVPRCQLVWGLRASQMQLDRYDFLSGALYGVERAFARIPGLLISNSHTGKADAARRGFPAERIAVVPNGIDTTRFRFDAGHRTRIRAELGLVGITSPVIAMVARIDPMKGYETFIDACALLTKAGVDAQFVCVGSGPAQYTQQLVARARSSGLGERMRWVPGRSDIHEVYPAFDVLVLPSRWGEGFPNVVAEAMSCQVPCVVTNLGDVPGIVGSEGEVAAIGDAQELSRAIRRMSERLVSDPQLGERCRRRIIECCSVGQLVAATEKLLLGLDGQGQGARAGGA